MIASVSFRPCNWKFWHCALAGFVCLAFAASARAGGGQDIEIVPFHDSTGTNFDRLPQSDSQNFSIWRPTAPDAVKSSGPGSRPTPLPRPQQNLTKEEQQLLDRRRNWVFMRPEDYATMDPKTGKSLFGDDNDKKGDENLSAMERFYKRMEDSGKSAATNEFSRFNLDRSSMQTNAYGSQLPTSKEVGTFGATPFNSTPDTGIFQPMTGGDSAKFFGGASVAPALSPEEVRIQTEQKTHMENFKQLWDIDQATAATPVVAPASGPIDSAPLFGASTPGMSSPFKAGGLSGSSSSGNSSKSQGSANDPVVQPRRTTPPHSDFMPTQRAF